MQAYLFVINHEYKSITDRDKYIEIFKPFAKHVEKNESGTLAFQMSISDKDPHKLIIFERYGGLTAPVVTVINSLCKSVAASLL